MRIGDRQYCVDPDRCEDPVDFSSLRANSLSTSPTYCPSNIETPPPGTPVPAYPEDEPFIVMSDICHAREGEFFYSDGPGTLMHTSVEVRTMARLQQTSGGFRHISPFLMLGPWELHCEYFLFGDEFIKTSCYWMPQMILVNSIGENHLQANLDDFYAYAFYDGECRDIVYPVRLLHDTSDRKSNVPEVSVEFIREYDVPVPFLHGWENYRPIVYPEIIYGSFRAWDIAQELPDVTAKKTHLDELHLWENRDPACH